MRGFRYIVTLLLILLSVSTPLKRAGAQRSAPFFREEGASIHVAVPVQGSAHFKRKGWKAYSLVTLGTFLRLGDSLRPKGGCEMIVVCSSLRLGYVDPGKWGVPCSEEPGPIRLFFGNSRIPPTRGSRPGTFPVILSPRGTRLLTPHPKLRWTAVPGATSYTVIVRGSQLQWKTQTGSTEITYPDNAPPLQPGVSYKLIVQAGQRDSSEEGLAQLGFRRLTLEESEQLHRDEEKIMALGLGKVPRELLLAHLFAAHQLYAEAIERLESLPATSQEPTLMRLTGELYLTTGLAWSSEERLLKARFLSQRSNDIEGNAIASRALAHLYSETIGNPREANAYIREALDLY